MNIIQNWNSLNVLPFYLDYFKDLTKIGYLTSDSCDSNYDYYLVDSNIGKIGILSAADLKTHQKKQNLGGEFRFFMLNIIKEDKYPKGLNKPIVSTWNQLFEDYSYLIMVTGCDDGHLAFYFKNQTDAFNILNQIDTIEDLMELTTGVNQVSEMIKQKQNLDSILIIGDTRN
jgi:hypothetical protein